jgi:hypothetical protein
MTWLALLAGVVLGFLAGRVFNTASGGLNVDSKERKQMWIREGR